MTEKGRKSYRESRRSELVLAPQGPLSTEQGILSLGAYPGMTPKYTHSQKDEERISQAPTKQD